LRQYVTNIVPDILIIDEVHTFSVSTEFLLSQIRDTLLTTNKKVKLVLMSATMDIDKVKDFFAPISKEIPVFDIP
jgi:HrpA-like RNA helicase